MLPSPRGPYRPVPSRQGAGKKRVQRETDELMGSLVKPLSSGKGMSRVGLHARSEFLFTFMWTELSRSLDVSCSRWGGSHSNSLTNGRKDGIMVSPREDCGAVDLGQIV